MLLNDHTKKYIETKSLFTQEDRILVTLSGGADSVALLRVLIQLKYHCEAAHCNFHLRGEESNRDETFVRELCRTHNVPLHVVHFDTNTYADEHHLSIEMAARELRYEWFERLRAQTGASVIAVAHHRDDSVETLLLNLIRGTGINGLRGIRPKNGYIVRPLLNVSREDILAYLASIGQDYVTDSTNLQDDYTRNKIRLNILPMMETINPSVKMSIADTASRLSEVACLYNKEMEAGKSRVTDGSDISIEALQKESAPQSLLFEILSPLGFNSVQVEEIYQRIDGQSGKQFFSSEWSLLKDRTHLLLRRRCEKPYSEEAFELSGSGSVAYGDGMTLHIERHPYTPDFVISRDKNVACLDADKLDFPLMLRRWRAGDNFVPFGMKGKKKVSDYLTDCKFSLHTKEQTYVVCSGDKIAWLVGERSDNRFRVDDHTKEIVLLKIR